MKVKVLIAVSVISGLSATAGSVRACDTTPPVAILTAEPQYIMKESNDIVLDGSDSYDPRRKGIHINGIKKFEWDFDYQGPVPFDPNYFTPDYNETLDCNTDGASDGNCTNIASYNEPGAYRVVMMVTDNANWTDAADCWVYVNRKISVPNDINNIQDAIYAADPDGGTTITVSPGIYYEAIDFNGVPCTLTSTDPCDPCVVANTVIDANNPSSAYAVTLNANAILEGITATGGKHGLYFIGAPSPTIRRCTIRDNSSYGIEVFSGSSPLISDCNIINNTSHGIRVNTSDCSPEITNCNISGNNWGVNCRYGSASLSNCKIIDNGSHGVICGNTNQCSVTLRNCVIAKHKEGDTSYGVRLNSSTVSDPSLITNCTIVDNNNAGNNSYGIWGPAQHQVTNCIIWNNGHEIGNGLSPTFSCIKGGNPEGLGNFCADPCLQDDYTLDPNQSPCVDAGEPWADWSLEPAPNGGRINLGAYGNTPQAAITVDKDEDGISDAWQRCYWPDYDPCNPDPNYGPDGNPDDDYFINLAEFLFGYDPNTAEMDEPMVITHVTLSASQIDPTQEQELNITYWINMDANVGTSFKDTDTSEIVRILQEAASVGFNDDTVWDGNDSSSEIVEKGFYDIQIDANDGAGHDANSKPGSVEVCYVHDITNLECNPYRILPLNNEVSHITYDLTTGANMVVTVYDPCDALFTTLVDDELQTQGSHQLTWYGMNKDPNDPTSRYISKDGPYLVRVRFVGMRESEETTIAAYK
ncbi:MAG: right-handed parallel beta-helix repeat-containing protein [Planctomycetota bacterium]|jgi:parallel beta-helix repeat protein